MAHPSRDLSPLGQSALLYAANGIPVFPLRPRGKEPLILKIHGGRGVHDATTDEAQVRTWWTKYPSANIGGSAGDAGWVVADIDPRNGGDYDRISAEHGDLPPTLSQESGGGGIQLMYAHPAPGVSHVRNKTNLLPGLDIKADGGYILLPPSIHPSGKAYRWLNDLALAPLPQWLAALLMKPRQPDPPDTPVQRRQDMLADGDYWLGKALAKVQAGEARNDTGFWLACQLRDSGLYYHEADGVMRDYAAYVPDRDHPYVEREALASLKSAYSEPPRERARSQTAAAARVIPMRRREFPPFPPDDPESPESDPDFPPDDPGSPPDEQRSATPREHRTDLGNARRFVRRHGKNVRYVAAWGTWLMWDGTRWQKDTTDAAMRKAKETVSGIYAEAADVGDGDDENERKEIAKWAMRSEGESRLRAMLALAESEPEVAIAPERLDAQHWSLNARNGTIDLRSGKLLEHDRAQLCTKRAETDYDPDALCDTWERFLDQIFAGDGELIAYVQRAIGYALTCEVSEQCVFVLYGTGANGKSTFLDTLCRILGDYAMTTPTDTLMIKQGQNIPSDVARLMGARFVAASESGDGRRLDEELVKRISGGDRMSARFMHRDWFEFYPVLKLFMACNHKPTIRGTDLGIWRRIQMWPFEVTIPPAKQDRRLARKLAEEAPGILAWAVRGGLAWQREGLNPPARVLAATQEYRAEMDAIGRFLDESCERHPTGVATAGALAERYSAWCKENGEHEQNRTRFGRYLREHGFHKAKDGHGLVIWIGLKLIPLQDDSGQFGQSGQLPDLFHTDMPMRDENPSNYPNYPNYPEQGREEFDV